MARRGQRTKAQPVPRRASRLSVVVTIIAIVAMVLGLIIAVIPGLFSGLDRGKEDFEIRLPTSPGAEEAKMRRRLAEDPSDVAAMVILADLLANTGRGNEAIPWYEKAVQARPDDETLRKAFGRVLMQQGYNLDAEIQFEAARELVPQDPEPVFLLGQLYENAEPPRPEDARQQYQQVVEIAPDSVYAARARERLTELEKNG